MKKTFSLILLIIICLGVFAQKKTVTFIGQNANDNSYVKLSRVVITNKSRNWTQTLTYPDTVAVFTDVTGIEGNTSNMTFGLLQNIPNPFIGATNVDLNIPEKGNVILEVTDILGRIIIPAKNFSLKGAGSHRFKINIATSGFYFLTARQNGKISSIKMINNGLGAVNNIEYVGAVGCNAKGIIDNEFTANDTMLYKGYAMIGGEEVESNEIVKKQQYPETIVLLFGDWENPNDSKPCTGDSTVTDVDGNIYHTVQIGRQCWMKENMRATRYADSSSIQYGLNTSKDVASWYYPRKDSLNKELYGLLYNWKAVMGNSHSSNLNPSGVQGICPTGWHVPSDAEWLQLLTYVSNQSKYVCGENTDNIAKSTASTFGWVSSDAFCSVGNDMNSNNATGFSVPPAGAFSGKSYFGFNGECNFWSTTLNGSEYAYLRWWDCKYANIQRVYSGISFGYSVRCLRD